MKKRSDLNKEKRIIFKKEGDLPQAAISLADTRYNKTGKWRSIKPVINLEQCSGCGICWKFCPDATITMVNGKPHIDLDYCKGCGICIEECPLKVIKDEEEKK